MYIKNSKYIKKNLKFLSSNKKIRVRLAANINKIDYLRILINQKQKKPSGAGNIITNISK